MSEYGDEFDPGNPEWWDEEEQADETIKIWKQSVNDYINFHNTKAEHVKFCKQLVLKIIPHTGVKDARWYKFPAVDFNTNQHKAHKILYETIRNQLEKLQNDVKKSKEQADKAKLEKQTEFKIDEKPKDKMEDTPKTNLTGTKRGRPSNRSQADSKSAHSSSNKQPKVNPPKIMDFGNSNQTVLKQTDIGNLKIEENVDDLHSLHIQYEAAMRETKRIKKAYNKQRESMKYIKTPVVSDSEL